MRSMISHAVAPCFAAATRRRKECSWPTRERRHHADQAERATEREQWATARRSAARTTCAAPPTTRRRRVRRRRRGSRRRGRRRRGQRLTSSVTSAAVIFDVDGTLVDSNDAHARAWVEAFAEQGITVAFERVRRAIGMGGDKLMPAVAGIEDDSPQGKRIAQRRGEIFKERVAAHLARLSATCGSSLERLRGRRLRARGGELGASRTSSSRCSNVAGVADLIADAPRRTTRRTRSRIRTSWRPRCSGRAATRRRHDHARRHALRRRGGLRAGIRIVGLECGGWSASRSARRGRGLRRSRRPARQVRDVDLRPLERSFRLTTAATPLAATATASWMPRALSAVADRFAA